MRETVTEWGVLTTTEDFLGVQARRDEKDAREFAGMIDPAERPTVVCRTVTRTDWREPITPDAIAAAIEAGKVAVCEGGVEYWPGCGRCEGCGRIQECPDCGGLGKLPPVVSDGP